MAIKSSKNKSGISPETRTIIVISFFIVCLVASMFLGMLVLLLPLLLMWFWTKWPKWVKLVITAPLAIFIALLILSTAAVVNYTFFYKPFQVAGKTMLPAYKDGTYLATKVYDHKNIAVNKNDIIIFKSSQNQEKDFIKRVVALPGETVIVQDGNVYLNGQKLDESQYVPTDSKTYGGSFLKDGQSITVPAGQYFVLGDNRMFSSDSREWGFVPQENIISKVAFCYWNCK